MLTLNSFLRSQKFKSQITDVELPLKISALTSWWTFIRLAWIYQFDRLVTCLVFGDLDLFFSHSVVSGMPFKLYDGFSPNLHRYIIVESIKGDLSLVT